MVEVTTKNKKVSNWFNNDVGLSEYYETFMKHGYNNLNTIKLISSKQDLEEMEIKMKGHQTMLMFEIQKLKNSTNTTDTIQANGNTNTNIMMNMNQMMNMNMNVKLPVQPQIVPMSPGSDSNNDHYGGFNVKNEVNDEMAITEEGVHNKNNEYDEQSSSDNEQSRRFKVTST
eukprot:65334_1